jgi:nucleotide-binding universal stress UspA family protein
MKNVEKILFATDFSEASKDACKYAIAMAKQFDAKLLVLHVIDELDFPLVGLFPDHYVKAHIKETAAGSSKMMTEFCSRNFKEFKNFESLILTGIPFKTIINKAESDDVSFIVVGTRGRTGIEHVLVGSTAEKIVRMSKCPVMTVRPQ